MEEKKQMTPAKKTKYRKDLAEALDFYHNTDMPISAVARRLELSDTAVHRMIEGKHPKWYQEELAVKKIEYPKDDTQPFYKFRDGFSIPTYMGYEIVDYIVHRRRPGVFLTAIICNDLKTAAFNADISNACMLVAYAGFFHNVAPSECHGSKAKMEAWIKG